MANEVSAVCSTNKSEALTVLEQKLTCQICKNIYDDPKVLSCLHSFCQECLQQIKVNEDIEDQTISCPSCQSQSKIPADGVAGLTTSYFMNNLKEVYRLLNATRGDTAEMCSFCKNSTVSCYCQECGSLSCENCIDFHRKWSINVDHHILSLDEIASNPYRYCKKKTMNCATHEKPVELFCETCQELVCCLCITGQHKNHNYNIPTDCIGKYQQVIEESVQKLQEKKGLLKEAVEAVEQRKKEIKLQGKRIEEEIHTELLKIEEQLLNDLSGSVEEKVKNLNEQVEEIKRASEHLTEHIDNIRDCMRTGTPQQLLVTKSIILESASKAASEIQEKDHTPVEKVDVKLVKERNFEDSKMKLMHIKCTKKTRKVSVKFIHSPPAISNKESKWVLALRYPDDSPAFFPSSELRCTLEHVYKDDFKCHLQRATCTVNKTNERGQYEISFVPFLKGPQALRIQYMSGKLEDVEGSPFNIYVSGVASDGDEPRVMTRHLKDPWGVCISAEHKLIAITGKHDYHSVYVSSENFDCRHSKSITSGGRDRAFRPRGVAITQKGTIIVVDCNSHGVKEVTLEGEVKFQIEKKGKGKLEFNYPTAVAVENQTQKIFIIEQENGRIQVLNQNFTFSHFISDGGSDLLFDIDGYLYLLKNESISKLTPEGQKLEELNFAIPPNGTTIRRKGMAIDKNELLYITEQKHNADNNKCLGSCISVYTKDGTLIHSYEENDKEYRCPIGIAVDESGDIYVCYYGSDKVVIY